MGYLARTWLGHVRALSYTVSGYFRARLHYALNQCESALRLVSHGYYLHRLSQLSAHIPFPDQDLAYPETRKEGP